MGARFSLDHANIVAYLTAPWSDEIPAVTLTQIKGFLFSLEEEVPISPHGGQAPAMQERLISSRETWKKKIQGCARWGIEELSTKYPGWGDDILERGLTKLVLGPLRDEFTRFELYALFVGRVSGNPQIESFWRYASQVSEGNGLYLFPDEDDWSSNFHALEPFPIVKLLSEQLDKWPGVVFWTRRGHSALVPIKDAGLVNEQLIQAVRNRRDTDGILGRYQLSSSKKLLQLSDLHFGKDEASENSSLLYTELYKIFPSVDRVVITGDLFDNPDKIAKAQFDGFLTVLHHSNKKEAIVIPGNHDCRWLGNSFFGIGTDYGQLIKLQLSSVETDDDLQCVFFCFDSSREGDLAKGKITSEQMRDVSVKFRTKCNKTPGLDQYKRIALIHHHPYQYATESKTIVQRFLDLIGKTDDEFLKLEDADEFLDWCVKMEIPLILHGHKHKQKHFFQHRYVQDETSRVDRDITSIGCGTSLGAEKYPLAYNIVAWDPASKRWSVSFYAAKADGSPFKEQAVSVSLVT